MNFRDRLRISDERHRDSLLKEAKEFRINNPKMGLNDFLERRGGLWEGHVEFPAVDPRLYQSK